MSKTKLLLEDGMSYLCNHIKDIKDNTNLVGESLGELAEATSTGFTEIEGQLDSLGDSLDSNTTQLSKVIEKLSSNNVALISINLEIPDIGWNELLPTDDDYSEYKYVIEVADNIITEDMIPSFTVHPQFLDIADEAQFSSVCQTKDGLVRFYAKSVLTSSITGILSLFTPLNIT